MTRRTHHFPSWSNHTDAYSAAIDSIAAASFAARSVTDQPEPDETVDRIVNTLDPSAVEFSSSSSAGGDVPFSENGDHDVGTSLATSHAGQVKSLAGAWLETDKGLDSTSVDAMGLTGVPLTLTTAAFHNDGAQAEMSATHAGVNQASAIPNGGTLELTSAYSGTITFDGAAGTLKIDDSADFSGKIAGQLAVGDVIDFADITAGASVNMSYSGNNSPGTLTVSDGTHTATVALLGNYSSTNFTALSDGHGGTLIIDPPVPSDGSAGAPGGAPQFSNILSGYAVRPSWKVAGVDYAVGVTPGAVLKDPATINMAGVTVDTNDHQIIVTAPNVTLNGYDFSLEGGWGVDTQAANTTISNCNFKIGSNGNFTIYGDTGSSNLTVINCVIDGNYQSDNLNNGLIYTSTPGLTVEYSLLEHGYSDFIQAQDGGQINIEYNFLNNNGNVNAHPDWLQTMGTASSPFVETIMYNTVYMTPNANDAGTQGFMLNDNGSTLSSAEFAYNTMIALPGTNVSPLTTLAGSTITGLAIVHDNFSDSRGGSYGSESFFADPAYSSNALYFNNTNMVTGGLYYQNATPSPTAAIAPEVNASVAPVSTDPTIVPSVTITSETANGNIVTLQGQAISSTAFPYTTVQVFDGSTQIGVVDSNANGAWSFTTTVLSAGTHSFTAKANNYYGYVSPVSAAVNLNIGGTAGSSVAPTVAISTAGGTTNQATHTISGSVTTSAGETASPGTTVTLYDNGTQIGAATVGSGGAWSTGVTLSGDGSHSIVAKDTDAAGNTGSSAPLVFTLDTIAPTVAISTVGGTTNQITHTISGTVTSTEAAAGTTVTLYDNSTQIGTATVGSGAWSTSVTLSGNGSHSIVAKDTDAAGNTGSSAPVVFTLDSVAPSTPTIVSFSPDTGVVGDGITSANKLTVTGTADPNSTITVYDGSTELGTTTASSTGSWDYITSILINAKHVLTATETNQGGQTSAASAPLTLTVDTHVPAAPVLVNDPVVNTNHVQLSGTAEANSSITVYDGTTVVGTATTSATGAWSVTTTALSSGTHALTATATDVAGKTSAISQALDAVIPGTSTGPTTPTIVSFSPDTGVAGDHITSENTLTLTGTALANSTVTVFDGTKQIGTATVDNSGQWTLTTPVLKDGTHSLTATDTDASGQTSATSAVLALTVDTHVPAAPVLVSDDIVNTNHVQLSGTAEANSSVTVYDGTTVVGTGTTSATGAWNLTTTALSSGAHALTATATDAAGKTSAISQALGPVIPGTSAGPTPPKIISFSPDTGAAGSPITNDDIVTLTGTAVAGSTVDVFDGTKLIGTTKAGSNGHWSLDTPELSNGDHSLTATDTDASGHTSVASKAFSITIDTHQPDAPTMAAYSPDGAVVGSTTALHDFILKGTAEANSTIDIFDGESSIGTATTSKGGTWSFDTGHLGNGDHIFTATATDAAGTTSQASETEITVTQSKSTVGFTSPPENRSHGDSTGHTIAKSSGEAILGSANGQSTLTSTSGNDLLVGNGHSDTFVFAANFGHDIIQNFVASGQGHDTIDFSKSVFDSFASVLAHASQVGHDVVISAGSDTLTLKNMKLGALDSHDFHFG